MHQWRTILVTSITNVSVSLHQVLATGAVCDSRVVLGVVIAAGVSAATLFTLVVVPVAYRLLTRATRSPLAVSRQLEAELRSEEHTSELQSRGHFVCRLLLDKKK